MKNIAYSFVSGGSYGQLYQEKNANGTVVVTLAITNTTTRTETRPDGATRTFTYGATLPGGAILPYLLKSYTDFFAHTTTLGYDANGYVNSITDANTHVTSFTRNPINGKITKVTHPGDASTIQYFYDSTGYYLDHVIDELNHTTWYKHNTDMTTYEIDYPDGGVEKFGYNGFNQVTSHTMVNNTAAAGSGGTETYEYDTHGLLASYTPPITGSDGNPGAHPTSYAYDINDLLSTIQDPRGNVTTLYHNEIGQVTIIQHDDTDQSLIGYTYNTDGTLNLMNVDYSTTGTASTTYTYDDYKRLRTITTPDRFTGDTTPHTTNFWYDKAGNTVGDLTHTDANVTRLVLPSGKVTKTVYDNNLHKLSVTAGFGTPDAAITSYTYDNVGNLKTMKDPNGQSSGAIWTYNYDARDRLINVIDPVAADRNSLGHTVDYTYDVAGNKKSEKRANDQTVTYDTYDLMNRLTKMTVPQTSSPSAVTNYTWTKAGKLDTMTDPRGNIYNYDYDRLNRLVTTTYPTGGGTETRTYDWTGNLLTFKNRGGNIETFTYDTRNREKTYSWSNGAPQARTLTYDDASRITSCNTTSTSINFVYYNDNTLKSQEAWTNYFGDSVYRTITYTYDADGNRASAALPNTITLGYAYTAREQLESVTNGIGGASLASTTTTTTSSTVFGGTGA
jgi:YD repeat-containing protein